MKQLIVLLNVLLLLSSCQKEETPTTCQDGFMYWGGDPAADGLGWYFSQTRISQNIYYLQEVADDFKRDSLPVSICLQKTNKPFFCQCAGTPPYYYRITKISKR